MVISTLGVKKGVGPLHLNGKECKMNYNFRSFSIRTIFLVFLCSFLLCSCAAQPVENEKIATPPVAPQVESDPPLDKAYKVVQIETIETTAEFEKDYREALIQLQDSAIWGLQKRMAYKKVGSSHPGATDALIVRITVTDMRIVSGNARFWGGILAGRSYMNLKIVLIDAMNQTAIRTKEISSSNNPFGAAYTSGGTDRSLPADMGEIVAEYIDSIMPK
jgi:hypothetical protein